MSNKGFSKMMHSAHDMQFLCPVCDKLSKVLRQGDIEVVDITFRKREYYFTCPHCSARSELDDGLKDFSAYA